MIHSSVTVVPLAFSLMIATAVHATGATEFPAGIADLALIDPVEGGPMAAIVVYPAAEIGPPTERGPYTIAATRDAKPADGVFPLVVMSHGTGGSMLGHHDSLTALAQAGFVAAAVQHPRDNYLDDSGFGTDLQLIGRPHHIVALIDGVLGDPRFGPLVDRRRIGMAGFSAGGYTTLVIVGGTPNFALNAAYRQAEPDDPLMLRALAAGSQRRKLDLPIVSDLRVRAAFVMAPALGQVFDKTALAEVHVPIRLYCAGADEVLRHPWNAERIRQMLPAAPEYEVIEGAGHYVFLAPCPAPMAASLPAICVDPPGIDRTAIHARLNAEMVEFFRRTLNPQ
jgi:predicted dienelactone hydrolase